MAVDKQASLKIETSPHDRGIARFVSRDVQGGQYTEMFLVSAVSTVLIVRAFLAATGYPQVGGKSQLHIAHMLWGGLLMLIAMSAVMIFYGRPLKAFAAVTGGIGFGLFIDEIGKFITKDNDYFYSPAIAVMYAVFVLFFIATRLLTRTRPMSPLDLRINALNAIDLQARGLLTERDRNRAVHFLDEAGPDDALGKAIREVLTSAWAVETNRHGFYERSRDRVTRFYSSLTARSYFRRALMVFFTIDGLASITVVAVALFRDSYGSGFIALGSAASAALVALCNLIGIVFLLRNRDVDGFRAFQVGVLISIFFGQVFNFAIDQLAAVSGLAFQLFVLGCVHYVIDHADEKVEEELNTPATTKALQPG